MRAVIDKCHRVHPQGGSPWAHKMIRGGSASRALPQGHRVHIQAEGVEGRSVNLSVNHLLLLCTVCLGITEGDADPAAAQLLHPGRAGIRHPWGFNAMVTSSRPTVGQGGTKVPTARVVSGAPKACRTLGKTLSQLI